MCIFPRFIHLDIQESNFSVIKYFILHINFQDSFLLFYDFFIPFGTLFIFVCTVCYLRQPLFVVNQRAVEW